MLSAGSLSHLAQFQRRAVTVDATGVNLGGFAAYGEAQWVALRNARGRSTRIGALDLTVVDTLVEMRDSDWGRTLSAADRLVIDGVDYEIATVHPPLDDGRLVFTAYGLPGRSDIEARLNQTGETVLLRRVGAGAVEKKVRALAVGFSPEELIGGIDQGERKIIIPAADVEAVGFPVPFKTGGSDKIVLRGRVLNIQDVDDSTWRRAGELIAYEIRATGA